MGLWLLALALAPALVLILFLVVGSFLKIDLSIDLGMVMWAVAIVVVAAIGYQLFVVYLRPRQTVSLGFNYKLIQPVLPLGRYLFRLEIFYEFEEKGARERVEQANIEMKFRGKDHPEVLQWCCGQIAENLRKHARFAGERYPGAKVFLPPEPTPEGLAPALAFDEALPTVVEGESIPVVSGLPIAGSRRQERV